MVKMKMALPLCMLAARKDAPESIGVLLSHGADVDGKNEEWHLRRPLCMLMVKVKMACGEGRMRLSR